MIALLEQRPTLTVLRAGHRQHMAQAAIPSRVCGFVYAPLTQSRLVRPASTKVTGDLVHATNFLHGPRSSVTCVQQVQYHQRPVMICFAARLHDGRRKCPPPGIRHDANAGTCSRRHRQSRLWALLLLLLLLFFTVQRLCRALTLLAAWVQCYRGNDPWYPRPSPRRRLQSSVYLRIYTPGRQETPVNMIEVGPLHSHL